MVLPSGASVGDKYVVVLKGKGTSADYGYTSDVLTVTKSSDDTSTLAGYTTTTGSTSVTLTPATGKVINKDYTVQWYKVTTDSIGVVSNAAISGATENTYELTTTDAKDTNAKYVAKVTASDGTVAYVYGTNVKAKIDDAIN